jgi:predicted nucleic acid-binding protein
MTNAPQKLSALVDLSVLIDAVVIRPTTIKKTITWGNTTQTYDIAGWERKPTLPPQHAWRQKQIDCLPTVARLSKEGLLDLCWYGELNIEAIRGGSGMAGTFGDLLANINLRRIRPAVERSRFHQTIDFRAYSEKDAQVELCCNLLAWDPGILRNAAVFWDSLPAFEQSNLQLLDEFKRLCRELTKNHYPDAFHLWTAERNGLDYYLTMERKFRKLMRRSTLQFKCKAVSPEELLQRFGITKLDPIPLPNGGPYLYF